MTNDSWTDDGLSMCEPHVCADSSLGSSVASDCVGTLCGHTWTLGSTQYWNPFLIPPPLRKKLRPVRIGQREQDVNSERNIDAKSWNLTAPSPFRGTVSSCCSNLIINFDTSRQLLSNLPGSTSIHFRSRYGMDTGDNVKLDVCCGLAFATSFPVLLSPTH